MSKSMSSKKPGYLFIASGVAFFVSSFLSEQTSLAGVGAMFICIGAALINTKVRKD